MMHHLDDIYKNTCKIIKFFSKFLKYNLWKKEPMWQRRIELY